jgi:hypothetical protein
LVIAMAETVNRVFTNTFWGFRLQPFAFRFRQMGGADNLLDENGVGGIA